MKRKNKQKKKLKAQSLTSRGLQPGSNTIKDDKLLKNNIERKRSIVAENDKGMVRICSEQDIEDEPVVDISYKEHLVLVGIGIGFSIILYMVSFLV
ncbi:MAG: hypothetical protein ACUZ8H_14920 [Candidatus Anammoxibacter sp.]